MSEKPTVVITGGLGFIGAQVSKTFANNGYDVIVIDSNTSRKWALPEGATLFPHDFQATTTAGILEMMKPQAVIHLAASHVVPDSIIDPGKYYKNNVSGTQTLLDMCVKAGVKNFIFSGSSSVYGERESREPFAETLTPMPMSPYAMSKHMTELMLEDYSKAYGLNYISTRYFNAAGADPEGKNGYTQEPATHVMPIIIDKITNDEVFNICGDDYDTKDGTCIRDYCHIQDIANAKLKAVEHLSNDGESGIVNLGSGTGFSIHDLIISAQNVVGKSLKYEVGPRRAGDPSYLCGDISKAKTLLDWEPTYSLDDMFAHSKFWVDNKNKVIKNK